MTTRHSGVERARSGAEPSPPRVITITAVNPPGLVVTADLGKGAPEDSVTGGWAFQPRPRRKGFTEWDGYDPYSLSIPIIFDEFEDGGSVEPSIDALHRIMRVPVGPRREPAACRIAAPNISPALLTLLWVVQSVTPDLDVTVRREDGQRIRAGFTVNFLEYVAGDAIVTVAPTPAQAAQQRPPTTTTGTVPRPAAVARTYTVKKGDTLWLIATRLLGKGTRWKEIATLNGIRDPRAVPVGKVLRIP